MNNKSLKILIASAAFLAILVTAGIIFFYPQAAKSQEPSPVQEWTAQDAVEDWGTLSQETPLEAPAQTTPEDPFVVLGQDEPAPQPETVPAPPVIPQERTVEPRPQAPVRTPTTVPAPRPTTPAPKPLPTVKVTEFWIQVAAYTDRYAAERSAKTLATQNLNAVVFTGQSDKGTVFRVRIGPYGNRQEAEKYLGWVKAIKDFSAAYITQSTALREVR